MVQNATHTLVSDTNFLPGEREFPTSLSLESAQLYFLKYQYQPVGAMRFNIGGIKFGDLSRLPNCQIKNLTKFSRYINPPPCVGGVVVAMLSVCLSNPSTVYTAYSTVATMVKKKGNTQIQGMQFSWCHLILWLFTALQKQSFTTNTTYQCYSNITSYHSVLINHATTQK